MANKKHFVWGIAAFALLFIVIFSACENGTTPDDTQRDVTDGQGEELTTVTLLALDEYVTAPVVNERPVTTVENGQYTGTITWTSETDTAIEGAFMSKIVYKAVISLTAKTGYTFEGLTINDFTYRGAAITAAAAGAQCTITVVFPAILVEVADIPEYLTDITGEHPAGTDEPVPLKLQIELSSENWQAILEDLSEADINVVLDLSACTSSNSASNGGLSANKVFDPYYADMDISRIAGKGMIQSLILPTAASSISGGGVEDWSSPVFDKFTCLKNVSGVSIETIGGSAFSGCTSLVEINFPKAASTASIASIGDYAFKNCTSLVEVNLPKATAIGDYAFKNCIRLVEINLPEATVIDANTFWDCSSLEEVNLPKVTSIGSNTFHGCTSLVEINLPEATSIGSNTFYGCTSLVEVNLPKATDISGAFIGCPSLVEINLPEATSIGSNTFYGCTSLEEVNLPKGTSIGSNTFWGCTSLEEVNLPKATSIGSGAFHFCTSLVEINLPEATSISNSFKDCTSLATVNLPKAADIGQSAFIGCTSLTTVNLPEATSIGGDAFTTQPGSTGSTALTVTFGAQQPTLGTNTFRYTSSKNVTIKVPSASLDTYSNGYNNSNTSDNNWGNAFRGKGWSGGTTYLTGTVNTNISLTFVGY